MFDRRSIRCWILGCKEGEHYPVCERCGLSTYDMPPIEEGVLPKLYWRVLNFLRSILSLFIRKKCCQCGKRFYKGRDDYMCSDKCHDEWIPF